MVVVDVEDVVYRVEMTVTFSMAMAMLAHVPKPYALWSVP